MLENITMNPKFLCIDCAEIVVPGLFHGHFIKHTDCGKCGEYKRCIRTNMINYFDKRYEKWVEESTTGL